MKLAVSLLAAGFAICAIPPAMHAQDRPNFSGTWILDKQHSGPEKVVWNQTRSGRFTIEHSPLEVTIDTGDGSLFGVREPVTEGPLVYKLDGSAVIVIDRSLGDLLGFVRKIRAEAKWDNAKLVTPSAIIPRIPHHGRVEDDLIYAKDSARYIKTSQP